MIFTIINYYRLQQTDFDGKSSLSKIVSVDNRDIKKEIKCIYNTIGQIVDIDYQGLKIIVFSDGSSEKRF